MPGRRRRRKVLPAFEDCSDRMYIEKMLPAYDGVEITKNMKVEYDRYGRNMKKEMCVLCRFICWEFSPTGM